LVNETLKSNKDPSGVQVEARLNVHGGKQKCGINYFVTYPPVVNWFSIQLMLVLSILNRWHTRQVDFIQAYPQAEIEYDLYMELPKGIQTKHGDGKTHVLKLLKNRYGQKQARACVVSTLISRPKGYWFLLKYLFTLKLLSLK
jgi:Reverse transcriptase (RNA-dependent DNA polymerase)